MNTKKAIMALERFEKLAKKHTKNQQYRYWVYNVLEQQLNSIKVVKGQFCLNGRFYEALITYIKHNHAQQFERRKEVKLDNEFYNFFNALKRKEVIHSSSTFYPKSWRLISINPNPYNLLRADFNVLDKFKENIDIFTTKMHNEKTIKNLYIYLRLYHPHLQTQQILKSLKNNDILYLSENQCVLIHYYKLFIKSKTSDTFYKTIVLDKNASVLLFSLKNNTERSSKFFKDIHLLEKSLQEYKEQVFQDMSFLSIKIVNKNYYTFEHTTLYNTLRSKTILSVPLSIAEVGSLYRNGGSPQQKSQEETYIKSVFSRKDKEKSSFSYENDIGYFDLYEIYELEKIFKNNNKKISVKEITNAIIAIKRYLELYDVEHTKIIYRYILDGLKKLLVNEIKLRTFQGQIWQLNKHIFTKIMNFEYIQDYEINDIMERFETILYTKNTLVSINRSLKRFFDFSKLEGFSIDVPSILYPKSIVFQNELDSILNNIKEDYFEKFDGRLTYIQKFKYIQLQAVVLIAFYSGLRKNEIRTRRLKDIYFNEGKIYIDVNKNKEHDLKTRNSLRRIEFTINDSGHYKIIKEWFGLREKIKNKSKHLFLQTDENKVYSKIMEEDIYDNLNWIIKTVTKRYATFHSLRHSYATYRVLDLLKEEDNNPYGLLELSIKMGHEIPETTLKTYVHFDLLLLMSKGLLFNRIN
ncbi:MAG: hypothetical protein COA44_15805 [Arcobacter sp.]|nr:MAG: hypothetical protein COA44_15805 [Arcobacter sp.]